MRLTLLSLLLLPFSCHGQFDCPLDDLEHCKDPITSVFPCDMATCAWDLDYLDSTHPPASCSDADFLNLNATDAIPDEYEPCIIWEMEYGDGAEEFPSETIFLNILQSPHSRDEFAVEVLERLFKVHLNIETLTLVQSGQLNDGTLVDTFSLKGKLLMDTDWNDWVPILRAEPSWRYTVAVIPGLPSDLGVLDSADLPEMEDTDEDEEWDHPFWIIIFAAAGLGLLGCAVVACYACFGAHGIEPKLQITQTTSMNVQSFEVADEDIESVAPCSTPKQAPTPSRMVVQRQENYQVFGDVADDDLSLVSERAVLTIRAMTLPVPQPVINDPPSVAEGSTDDSSLFMGPPPPKNNLLDDQNLLEVSAIQQESSSSSTKGEAFSAYVPNNDDNEMTDADSDIESIVLPGRMHRAITTPPPMLNKKNITNV